MKDKISHKQKNPPKEGNKIVHNPKFMANFFVNRILILLIIAVLFSVPLVSALSVDQSFGFLGGWRWFVVNTAIVFAVLFVAQTILVPGKVDKEKPISWLFVILASLAISWFVSSSGYIWQHEKIGFLFKLPVIVNAAIIGLVLYLILPWLKIDLKSPQGKIGGGILVGIIALAIAANMGDKFLWQLETLQGLWSYLFGEKGILTINPEKGNYRLMVFVVMSVLISWILNNLGVNEKQQRINYVLAVLIAANMARAGLTIKAATHIGQIAAILILGNGLSKQWGGENGKGRRLWAYLFIAVLIEWAVIAVNPGYAIINDISPIKIGKSAVEVIKPDGTTGPIVAEKGGLKWWHILIALIVSIAGGSILLPLVHSVRRRSPPQQTTPPAQNQTQHQNSQEQGQPPPQTIP